MISFIRIEKTAASLSKKVNRISAAAVVFIMLLTVADVVGRLFGSPVPGTYELVSFVGALIISFALPYTSVEKGHIAVDFLMLKMPYLVRVIVNAINALIATALFGVISWQSAVYALSLKGSGEVSATLKMPVYPFLYGISLGCGLLAVVLFIEFIGQLKGAEIE